MKNEFYKIKEGNAPLVAAAIHDGHLIRDEVSEIMKLSDSERLREEDPFTGEWANIAETTIVVHRSRFEMDLNRPRDKAVYINPEDAWGLDVWIQKPSEELVKRSLSQYDEFYDSVHKTLRKLEERFGYFVVFDLHTYNHLRDGQNKSADPALNPEVNLGTGNLDREYWAPVIDGFISDLSQFNYFDRKLDVRENVKFRGGQFSRWVSENFPKSGCAIAIEFKKIFMDEWSGKLFKDHFEAINEALASTVPGVLKQLESFKRES